MDSLLFERLRRNVVEETENTIHTDVSQRSKNGDLSNVYEALRLLFRKTPDQFAAEIVRA